ncbi:hypothetical protein V8F20_002716 [Naviculisporaceae sp. PSN 640]
MDATLDFVLQGRRMELLQCDRVGYWQWLIFYDGKELSDADIDFLYHTPGLCTCPSCPSLKEQFQQQVDSAFQNIDPHDLRAREVDSTAMRSRQVTQLVEETSLQFAKLAEKTNQQLVKGWTLAANLCSSMRLCHATELKVSLDGGNPGRSREFGSTTCLVSTHDCRDDLQAIDSPSRRTTWWYDEDQSVPVATGMKVLRLELQ